MANNKGQIPAPPVLPGQQPTKTSKPVPAKGSQGGNGPIVKPKKGVAQSPKDKIKEWVKEQLRQAAELQERLPAIEKDAEERISYAKSRLMQMEPFFAMLLFKMPVYPNYQIPTCATDGSVLLYNPLFVTQKLMRKDLIFVLLHEICHVFWKHNIRGPIKAVNMKKVIEYRKAMQERGKQDDFLNRAIAEMEHKLKEWNFATDYIINNHISEILKIPVTKQLKEMLLFDKQWLDKTSEFVYDKIKTPFKENPNQQGSCSSAESKEGTNGDDAEDDMGIGVGGILPAGFGDLSEEEVRTLEKEFEQEVKSAAMVAKRAGKLPAGVQDVIDSIYTTSTPWQDVFRTIFTSINKQDYTFQFPNRRYTGHMMDYGVIMPSLWGEEYVDCGMIMDTSGSVGKREKEILASELKAILEDYPIRLHVIYCDTKAYVDDVQVFTQSDIKNGRLRLDVKGGGGTQMKPAFDYFRDKSQELDIQVVVCLTDMYLFDWGKLGPQPEFSVYWACLPDYDKKVKPDWGVKVEIQLDGENT